MSYEDMRHPGEREAERLRIIIRTYADAHPSMEIGIAADAIFATEKRTAELEKAQWEKVRTPGPIELPDSSPETVAKFVDLQPVIQDFMPDQKINAIKELRSRAGLHLKEAKEGIEHWENTRWPGRSSTPFFGSPAPSVPSATVSTAVPVSDTPTHVAAWIDTRSDILDVLEGRAAIASPKIYAISCVRHAASVGLKQAKEGVEEWIRINPARSKV